MPYADVAAYNAALARGRWFTLAPNTYPNNTWPVSAWPLAIPTATPPTSPVVPPRLGFGAFSQPAGNWRLAKVRASGEAGSSVMIVDRLSHQGGLSGVATGEQTLNLPTAPLTRYVDGEGVMAALEVHSSIGASAVDTTARYTNTTPTANRNTTPTNFGANGRQGVGMFLPLPLQAGDTGVISVEGVTLAATTGTVGAFGVVLFKPLTAPLAINGAYDNHTDWEYDIFMRTGACPLVLDGACLTAVAFAPASVEAMLDVFLIPE